MIKTFSEWLILREASYGDADVPDWFYTVLKPNEVEEAQQTWQIKRDSITSSYNTARVFGYGGNYIVKMPAKAVLYLNKLSRVMYDNPDYIRNASQNPDSKYRSSIWGSNTENPHARTQISRSVADNALGSVMSFKGEHAWVVKNGILNIPQNSLFFEPGHGHKILQHDHEQDWPNKKPTPTNKPNFN